MLRSRVVLDRGRQRGLRYLRDRLLTLPSLDLLEEEVTQGREQVRRDLRRLRVEPVETRHGADERLLDEVVGVVDVAGQSVGERPQPGLVLGVQLLPCLPVACPETPEELGVRRPGDGRHRLIVGRTSSKIFLEAACLARERSIAAIPWAAHSGSQRSSTSSGGGCESCGRSCRPLVVEVDGREARIFT